MKGWLGVVCLGTCVLAVGAPVEGVHTPLRSIQCEGATYDEYTLGDRVTPGKPLLRDLFSGEATLPGIADKNTEDVGITFTTPGVGTFDARIAVFRVPGRAEHFAFVRGIMDGYFSVYLIASKDGGRTFTETVGDTRNVSSGNVSVHHNVPSRYDNHIDPAVALDYSTCPPTYRLTTECSDTRTGHVEVCVSETKTPLDLKSWSRVETLVRGDNATHSGSTGVLLMDSRKDGAGNWKTRRYVKWTDVQNHDGLVTTVVAANDALRLLGWSGKVGQIALDAKPYPCRDGWDCNNKDGQDWKREGDEYFLSYNGGNFYGCQGAPSGENWWGLSFARAKGSPLAAYERLAKPLVMAPRKDVCGLSYPYVNVIGGEIYVYYAYYEAGGPYPGKNRAVRARLVRKAKR